MQRGGGTPVQLRGLQGQWGTSGACADSTGAYVSRCDAWRRGTVAPDAWNPAIADPPRGRLTDWRTHRRWAASRAGSRRSGTLLTSGEIEGERLAAVADDHRLVAP